MERFEELSELIKENYGEMGPVEIDRIAANYPRVITRMLEVTEVRPQATVLMDLFEELEFKPVIFPDNLRALLRAEDVFLATLGYEKGKWEIIHLSPPYESEEFEKEF